MCHFSVSIILAKGEVKMRAIGGEMQAHCRMHRGREVLRSTHAVIWLQIHSATFSFELLCHHPSTVFKFVWASLDLCQSSSRRRRPSSCLFLLQDCHNNAIQHGCNT